MKNLCADTVYLVLSDGTVYTGKSFGAKETVYGEIVCSTSMVGYQEELTDPCFCGQILLRTFPVTGVYGVNHEDVESEAVHPIGYIVRDWCDTPSNFRSECTIDEYLKANNVTGVFGIDTRALTRKLKSGEIYGCAITSHLPENIEELLLNIDKSIRKNYLKSTACKESYVVKCENAGYTVVMYDYGCKKSMINALLEQKCNVVVVPPDTDFNTVCQYMPDGFVFSDGPGNPCDNKEFIPYVTQVINSGKPVIASGFGHQIVAMAHGCEVSKLKNPHIGASVPVTDTHNNRVFITSQNHSYFVESKSVSPQLGDVIYTNTNDGSCEGIDYMCGNILTVQFSPVDMKDADGKTIFDEFICMMKRGKNNAASE